MFKRRKPDEPAPTGSAASMSEPVPKMSIPPIPSATKPADGGLGVPLRPVPPAPPQETSAMSRPPIPATPTPPIPPQNVQPPRPPGASSLSGLGGPVRAPQTERRTLVVGRGISVQGSVQDAERLVVEGTVEATMIRATELSVAPGGVFRGEVEVEEAELAGTIDGTLITHGTLVVRSSGKLLGSARCKRLQVEDGGQISGRLEMLADGTPRSETAKAGASEPGKPGDRPAPLQIAPADATVS